MVERAWETFPDYHEEMLAIVVEGDLAAVHLRITGTQHGAWGHCLRLVAASSSRR